MLVFLVAWNWNYSHNGLNLKPIGDTGIVKLSRYHFNEADAIEHYKQFDLTQRGSTGCFRKCKEIVKNPIYAGDALYQLAIGRGKNLKKLPFYYEGIEYLDSLLEQGIPVIVGVDYKDSKYNEGTTDHYVVVLGKNSQGYRFIDPRTEHKEYAVSETNVLKLNKDGLYQCDQYFNKYNKRTYYLTQVRIYI